MVALFIYFWINAFLLGTTLQTMYRDKEAGKWLKATIAFGIILFGLIYFIISLFRKDDNI